ncbi:MAG: COR domain-containing protein [Kordia sp.]
MVESEVSRIQNILIESFKRGFKEVNLSFNDLRNVPYFIFERPFIVKKSNKSSYKSLPYEKVRKLNLSNNYIKDLGKELSLFKSLEELDISDNEISSLPRQITQLSKIKFIKLNNNPISYLPEKIASFNLLQSIDLSQTNIYAFPPNFKYLLNLKYLNISNCKITILPREIVELPNLETLELNGTPLVEPPIEIACKGIEAIKRYYEEIDASSEKDNLYEVKLLLVGEERVGKTTIVEALSNPNFEFDLYKDSTEGIDIKTWIIEKEKLKFKKEFKINIWDFGGQEIYHATHQFFLTKRSIYFLVTEARKDLRHDDLFYWLNLIEVLGDKSPVIIINNKCDKSHTFFATDAYREKFPNIICTKDISCLPEKEYTIKELKQSIYTIIVDDKLMPDVGIELPKVWVDIRNELNLIRESGISYISNKRYLQICKKYSMSYERADFLSDYLHDLGVFLHFKSDKTLINTIFLDFKWVTRAVYCILDNVKIISQNGFFEDKDLDHLWNKYGYNNKRKELLTLMKNEKFEICFELERGKFLAPQLLHPDRIKFSFPDQNIDLRFEFWYKFMPKGIISRFIVKRHKLVFEKKYWKHGVVLMYHDTYAIIEEKYFESPKKISVSISGENSKQLLSLIRKSISDINSSFNHIETREMVQCNCSSCIKSDFPSFFNLKELNNRIKNKKYLIECRKEPYEKISVANLMNSVIVDINYIDEPLIPEEFEKYDERLAIKEIEDVRQVAGKAKQNLIDKENEIKKIKKLKGEIEIRKRTFSELEKRKKYFDKLAVFNLKKILFFVSVINILFLSSWILLIYYKGWNIMEPYTYIAGVVLFMLDFLYFTLYHKSLSMQDMWYKKLENKKTAIYLTNNFNKPEYEHLKVELQELENEYDKLLK